MNQEKFPSSDHKKSFGKMIREKVFRALRNSHDLINDTAETVDEVLNETFREIKNKGGESEYLIPILVEYTLYAADDVGRDLGEISRGILQGVVKAAKELGTDVNDWVEKTARAMLLESDWRDIDLRIVIENFIRKNIPDAKELLKKIYLSEKVAGETQRAA